MLCHMSKVQATEQSSFFLMEMNCCEKNVQENGRIQVKYGHSYPELYHDMTATKKWSRQAHNLALIQMVVEPGVKQDSTKLKIVNN